VSASTGRPAGVRLGDALLAGYPLVLAARAFRELFLVLLLAGTAQGMAMAYVSVWASDTFHIGFGIALWSTATLIYLQRLMPGRAGMAGGLYVAVQQVTPVLSGLLLGPIAETSGIAAAFATTAALGVVALALLAVAHRALVVR
jgi:predicted MFS family arabinose efflux permease